MSYFQGNSLFLAFIIRCNLFSNVVFYIPCSLLKSFIAGKVNRVANLQLSVIKEYCLDVLYISIELYYWNIKYIFGCSNQYAPNYMPPSYSGS